MNLQKDPGLPTEKKFAEIFEDLESPQAYMYVITKTRIYQFDPLRLDEFLDKFCRRSISTDDVGVALQFDGEDPDSDWVRWQNRGQNL